MGKNNWPDFDAIIQKAVNAGRAQGMSIAKDAYKATERRLYALPVLRQKVEDDKEKLEQIKTHGAPERSKSIVRFSRTGYRLTPEEMLEAIIKDLEATIAADEYEIETLEKALAHIEDDPFYPAVEAKYIDGLEDDDIAADLKCGNTQLWKDVYKRQTLSRASRRSGPTCPSCSTSSPSSSAKTKTRRRRSSNTLRTSSRTPYEQANFEEAGKTVHGQLHPRENTRSLYLRGGTPPVRQRLCPAVRRAGGALPGNSEGGPA